MSLAPSTPSTMLGLVAHEQWQTQKSATAPKRRVLRVVLRRAAATIALVIGISGFSMGTAQAWIFDDMKENLTSTIVNMCGPNDIPAQTNYQNVDTLAGLNKNPSEGARATVKPNWSGNTASKSGDARERLQEVYGDKADVIEPAYERYGFSSLRWNQYGYDCFSPTLLMGPASNMALFSMVHVPMMISMSILNLAMDNILYRGFAVLMEPFIGAMYEIFSPWIFFIVPIGIAITWVTSKGSLQATLKAAGWGVAMLSVFLLMGSSTSRIVTWSTNIVTEVSGSAACKMSAATEDNKTAAEDKCDPKDPIKAVNQALWYGVPYQTWLVGQVGETEAAKDQAASDGDVTWGAALLNGNYVGVNEDGETDKAGRGVLQATEEWNALPYTDEGKVQAWGKEDAWNDIPALANVKMICNDVDKFDDDPGGDPGKAQRWMFSGAGGADSCDTNGAGTTSMTPTFRGDEYNKQFLTALSGMIGVGAVALTIGGASLYLGFQKMSFFFLLFLGPIVLTISALGDSKRRPFAIRYAELLGANLLKQVAAVCVVLFVSYSMASLFGSESFGSVPWIMKPYVAGIFFLALVMMAFPMKNLLKGAVQGDTSALDKAASAPADALKTTAKVGAVATAAVATGGVSAAMGGGTALAGMGGKAAALGKSGTMLGQAGKVMGIGSKTGRAMRASGALMKAGQGVMESKDVATGRKEALGKAAQSLINGPEGGKYRDQKTGQLLPDAQKMAMKDAAKMSETGQKSDRASKAQDAQMAQFFQGYKAKTGDFHRDDPTSPSNKQAAQAQFERDRRSAKSEVDAETAKQNGQGGKGTGSDGPSVATPGRGNPQNGVTDYTPTKEDYQAKARANLGGPTFAREMDYSTATAATGEEVLHKNGLSKDQVLADPTTLLRGDAYEGGSTAKMDPFHPATGALNELRFASSSGDEQAMETAVAKSVDAIAAHGVPDQINDISSIGDRAKSFEGIELLGAMPSITQDTPWSERAEAAQTMMAAQVAMPQGYEAREAVQDYTAALANPGVDPTSLEAMKTQAMDAINDSIGQGVPTPSTGPGDGGVLAGSVVAGAAANEAFSGEDHHKTPVQDANFGGGYSEPTPAGDPYASAQPTMDAPAQDYLAPTESPAPRETPTDVPGQDANFGGPAPAGEPYTGQVPPAQQDHGAAADAPTQGAPVSAYQGEAGEASPTAPPEVTYPGPSSVAYNGPSSVAYNGPGTPVDQVGSGHVEPMEGPRQEDRPAQTEQVSRDDLRQAVADGLRESRQEQSVAPAQFEAPEAPSAPTSHTAAPNVDSAPVGETPFRSASTHETTPGTGPAVEPVPEDDGIFFRPGKKRRRNDDDEDEGDEG